MSTDLLLSIIIPNYNGEEILTRCLDNVFEAVDSVKFKTEVIVSDDASTDRSLDVLAKFPRIRLVVRETNGGFSKNCNTGLAEAKGKILLFLNTDALLEPDFLQYCEEDFRDPDVFAVTPLGFTTGTGKERDGGRLGYWSLGAPRVSKNYFEADALRNHLSKPYPSITVVGSYFFCDANKMRQLNGFDPLFSPFLYEEVDLSYRALKRGWKVLFDPRMKAYHEGSVTLNKVSRPFNQLSIAKRNQLIFCLINVHAPRLFASFILFLFLRLLVFRAVHWAACLRLLPLLPRIVKRRKEEKSAAVVGDRVLFQAYDLRGLLANRKKA